MFPSHSPAIYEFLKEHRLVETAQLDGPFGARGVGEHPMISVAPAIGNAIQHATGAELMHMPMRFEDVWRALQNKAPIDNWITETPTGSCRSDLPGGGGDQHDLARQR